MRSGRRVCTIAALIVGTAVVSAWSVGAGTTTPTTDPAPTTTVEAGSVPDTDGLPGAPSTTSAASGPTSPTSGTLPLPGPPPTRPVAALDTDADDGFEESELPAELVWGIVVSVLIAAAVAFHLLRSHRRRPERRT
jgi:hypothetical protein